MRPTGTPAWLNAVSFAARAHQHQRRKDGTTPYAAHPMRVSLIVRDVFDCADQAALCAALLHDTIEDTGTDYDEIQESFGTDVADLVAALTKNMMLPEVEREQEYDTRLSRADWRARLIKLADCYDNLCDRVRGERGPDPDELHRTIEHCRRAIRLATVDAASQPATRCAIDAVNTLLNSAEADDTTGE